MENTPAPTPEITSAPKKKKRIIWRMFKWLFLLTGLGAAGFAAYLYLYPVADHAIYNFVPKDAVFVIEADDPIENWKSFSDTKIWRHLKKNAVFADIESSADYLDTLVRDNAQIFSLISGKKLLISAQMTKATDYDFLYIMDLKKGAKIQVVFDLFKGVLKSFGLPLKEKDLDGRQIYMIGDPGDEVLLTFEGNIMLASFNEKLLQNGLNASKASAWGTNAHFLKLHDDVYGLHSRNSLVKVHLNFAQLDAYMKVFMDDVSTVTSISKMMDFAAFDLKMRDEYAEMGGFATVDTTQESMASVLLQVEGNRVRAHNILPKSTSFLLTLDFDDFATFYEKIGEIMKEDPGYQEYESTQKSIGKLLGVAKSDKKVERKKKKGKDLDYFDWIGEEVAVAMMPADSSGTLQSYVAAFHIPDKANAEHDLLAIEKKIRSRTPVKFEAYEYKGKTVSYLAMKGFFRLFLGKLFKKFDQPKYTILDEFVVFSNDTAAIHTIIDVVNGERLALPNDPAYRTFFNNFDDESNCYIYLNSHNLYPYLPSLASPETGQSIYKNEKFITCFPRAGLQLSTEDGRFKAKIHMDFDTSPRRPWWQEGSGESL